MIVWRLFWRDFKCILYICSFSYIAHNAIVSWDPLKSNSWRVSRGVTSSRARLFLLFGWLPDCRETLNQVLPILLKSIFALLGPSSANIMLFHSNSVPKHLYCAPLLDWISSHDYAVVSHTSPTIKVWKCTWKCKNNTSSIDVFNTCSLIDYKQR